MPKLELLAPAGDYESFILAINNGANAIYLAGKNYGARAYANNFTIEELELMIRYAHECGVKVYITVNTIVKNKELNDCIEFVQKIYKMGVDAIIIQDLGLASILRKMMPALNLHASTQMNCHSVAYARDLAKMGFKRVILARETPIEVVKEIASKVDIEVEVFAHGALCMCYSGNCYLSSIIGKRSGNRGRCAQPCRLAYKLESSDYSSSAKYYLSPRDLCEINNINELKEAGITSIKLEGRMKRPEYVGLITNRYRKAIDNNLSIKQIEQYKKDLAVMFNRSFTKGYLFNEANKHFTNVSTSNHIGIKVGKVTRYKNGYAFIKLEDDIKAGDGLRILSNDNDAIIVNEMFVNGIKGSIAHIGDLIQVKTHKEVDEGSLVLKTSDAKLIDEVNNASKKKILLDAKLYLDETAHLEVTDGINKVCIASCFPYEEAKSDSVKIRQEEQLRKTSDSIYEFRNIEIVDNIFLPIKEINELRRMAIYAISAKRRNVDIKDIKKYEINDVDIPSSNEKHLFFKVRTMFQLEACIKTGVKDIIVDDEKLFEEAKKYQLLDKDINVLLIDKRINNNGIYNKKVVDVYSNVINYATVRYYLENGAKIVCMSIEASSEDIKSTIDLYKDIYKDIPNIMVMVYGYYELMIMKHCLISKALGHEEKGCGECFKKDYYLVDRIGYKFPLINDGACNLKLLNAKRLHLIDKMDELLKMGVNNLLVDLSIEDDYELVIKEYLNAFGDALEGTKYVSDFELDNVTYGHYKEGIE